MDKATFGAGCFWGVEEAFRALDGVTNTRVGYCGGHFAHPTYADVCSGTTGHAEVVEVEYDPSKASYTDLLKVFWDSHDPTTRNRQGPDVGEQYRSAIFWHTDEQRQAAETSKAAEEASKRHAGRIVTEIAQAPEFWEAEDYHQKYLARRGRSSCHL